MTARSAGLQRGPAGWPLLVHRRLEPARAGRLGGRLRVRPAGRQHRPLYRPAGEPRRRRRPLARRLGPGLRGRLPRRAGRLAGRRAGMIDPLTRWAAYGEKPDYAGLMTYAGLPYT